MKAGIEGTEKGYYEKKCRKANEERPWKHGRTEETNEARKDFRTKGTGCKEGRQEGREVAK